MFRSQTDHHQGDTMLLQQQDKTGSNTHITTGMLLHQYIKFSN